jgi:hypothetical protein
MTTRSFVTIAIALTALVTSTEAAEPFAGRRSDISVTFLEFPQGLRNIGMGATGVSDINQPTTGYYNPATLAWADATWVTFGYQELFLDVTMTDTRMVYGNRWSDESSENAWRLGGVVGYTTMDLEAQVVRTVYLPEGTGETWNPHDYYLTSALAGAVERGNESLAAGVAAKYLSLDSGSGDSEAWLFDYGFVAAMRILINGSMLRPRLGFSATNLDTGLEIDSTEYDIVGQMRVGIGVDFATPPTTYASRDVALASGSFAADYTDRGDYDSFWSIGWEVSILEMVQARAGYQWYEDGPTNQGDRSNLWLGFGVGWVFGRWTVRADYAHMNPRPNYFDLDINQDMFGVTLGGRL